jgi:hypothetical protein
MIGATGGDARLSPRIWLNRRKRRSAMFCMSRSVRLRAMQCVW